MPGKSPMDKELDQLAKMRAALGEEEYERRRQSILTSRTKTLLPNGGGKRGHKGLYILGGIIGAVVLLVVIVAATGGGDDKEANGAAPAASTSSLPANQVQIGNLLLTLNGTADYVDKTFPAEAGTHYVSVDVTAKNTGDKTYALNVLNFHLKDSAAFANNQAITAGPDPKIGHVDMTKDQEVRGFIVFKIKDGVTPAELQYQSFTGTPGVIKVGQ